MAIIGLAVADLTGHRANRQGRRRGGRRRQEARQGRQEPPPTEVQGGVDFSGKLSRLVQNLSGLVLTCPCSSRLCERSRHRALLRGEGGDRQDHSEGPHP